MEAIRNIQALINGKTSGANPHRLENLWLKVYSEEHQNILDITTCFSILCLTRDFIRQGHAREKRKVYRATRTRSQAIDRG